MRPIRAVGVVPRHRLYTNQPGFQGRGDRFPHEPWCSQEIRQLFPWVLRIN